MKTVEAVKPIIRILGSLYKCKRNLPIPESVIDFATFSVANVPPKYAHNNNSHQIPTTYATYALSKLQKHFLVYNLLFICETIKTEG